MRARRKNIYLPAEREICTNECGIASCNVAARDRNNTLSSYNINCSRAAAAPSQRQQRFLLWSTIFAGQGGDIKRDFYSRSHAHSLTQTSIYFLNLSPHTRQQHLPRCGAAAAARTLHAADEKDIIMHFSLATGPLDAY